MSEYAHHKYTYSKPWGSPHHDWSVIGARGAVNFHVSVTPGYPESAGLEFHHFEPSSYQKKDAPPQLSCPLTGGRCWHDGTSLYATETLWPRIKHLLADGNHDGVFSILEVEIDRRFTELDEEEKPLTAQEKYNIDYAIYEQEHEDWESHIRSAGGSNGWSEPQPPPMPAFEAPEEPVVLEQVGEARLRQIIRDGQCVQQHAVTAYSRNYGKEQESMARELLDLRAAQPSPDQDGAKPTRDSYEAAEAWWIGKKSLDLDSHSDFAIEGFVAGATWAQSEPQAPEEPVDVYARDRALTGDHALPRDAAQPSPDSGEGSEITTLREALKGLLGRYIKVVAEGINMGDPDPEKHTQVVVARAALKQTEGGEGDGTQ